MGVDNGKRRRKVVEMIVQEQRETKEKEGGKW